MGPPKAKVAAPSGRALMTAQQKKDADIANIGAKSAAKKAAAVDAGDKPASKADLDKIRADAAYQKHLSEGGAPRVEGGKKGGKKAKEDLSFLDASVPGKKK